ncbi:DUF3139 domain-containing protein [Paenibacillus sp. CFBP13512]|uniref:DUF3139 domain-containing protein n=1 Tax=Paenibacillus sp. CFBP13512 TaxID=2184007 RepID=UPI001F500848|nr:DUF3139 domain-containing protein [Paenibacillus sp. CFBP13512]
MEGVKKMKYKKTWITILSVVVILGVTVHFGLNYYKDKVTQEVISYLVDEKGYKSTDIDEIKTYIGKAPVVSTSVIFKDEPNAMYMYKEEAGHMKQYKAIPAINDLKQKYIHSEEPQ